MLLAAIMQCKPSMHVLTSASLLCSSLEHYASLMVPPRVGAAGQEEAGQQHAAAGSVLLKQVGMLSAVRTCYCASSGTDRGAQRLRAGASHSGAHMPRLHLMWCPLTCAQQTAPASSCQPVSALVLLVLARRAAPSAVLRACVECAQSGALTLTLYRASCGCTQAGRQAGTQAGRQAGRQAGAPAQAIRPARGCPTVPKLQKAQRMHAHAAVGWRTWHHPHPQCPPAPRPGPAPRPPAAPSCALRPPMHGHGRPSRRRAPPVLICSAWHGICLLRADCWRAGPAAIGCVTWLRRRVGAQPS